MLPAAGRLGPPSPPGDVGGELCGHTHRQNGRQRTASDSPRPSSGRPESGDRSIQTASGGIVTYRKYNKPAVGPVQRRSSNQRLGDAEMNHELRHGEPAHDKVRDIVVKNLCPKPEVLLYCLAAKADVV